MNRRTFLERSAAATAASLIPSGDVQRRRSHARQAITINPTPRFEISPYLYMQFMEPLGVTDGSVRAAWDYLADDWRDDLVEAVRDLAPDAIRWGGNFIRYYKWREGVGSVHDRPPMINYIWGGKEDNRVGTHEFVDLCRRTGAEPILCVNFLSDGHERFWQTVHGTYRAGDAEEAADWVSYANDPDDPMRRAHGVEEPYGVKLWEIGNETSYTRRGFPLEEAIAHTIDFARAMKARDPSIELMGWGDDFRHDGDFWAPHMLEAAGEHLEYVNMHMMGMRPMRDDTVLVGFEYQEDPAQAWEELLEMADVAEQRLEDFIASVSGYDHGVAVTEGHVSIDPHNSNPILQEWLSAVYHAKTMNAYLRRGDRVRVCTGADFCGTRWTVNAVRIPVPRGQSFLLPIASIMRLFKRHKGTYGVTVESGSPYLDVAASVDVAAPGSASASKIYLHVLNTNFTDGIEAELLVDAGEANAPANRGGGSDSRGGTPTVRGGRVFEIAPEHPRAYVDRNHPETFTPVEKALPEGETSWRFPARSVSVVELELEG